APRPRADGSDTYFLGPAPDLPAKALDVRDPRNRNLFLLSEGEMDLDRLKRGAAVAEPTVSASMATAVLAYSGIAVKMLVDQRLDAQLHTMFMVDYQPGAVAHPHDHPFEESYYMLEGEVDVVADGDRHTLRPGDVFWTGGDCDRRREPAGGARPCCGDVPRSRSRAGARRRSAEAPRRDARARDGHQRRPRRLDERQLARRPAHRLLRDRWREHRGRD